MLNGRRCLLLSCGRLHDLASTLFHIALGVKYYRYIGGLHLEKQTHHSTNVPCFYFRSLSVNMELVLARP
jgi:hypothetical protein